MTSKEPSRPSPRIFTTDDARARARIRLPRLVFDFLEGGVGHEVALNANFAALDTIKLQSRVLKNVSERDLGTTFLGRHYGLPFGIAPMGMCNLTHPRADACLARAAIDANIPICLSTAASTLIEEMARLAGENAWFQLYVGQSQEQGFEMADRARKAGYHTLILTVDTPQVSRRARDLRNGFQVPFRIGPRQFLDFAMHPRWSLTTLAAGQPSPANFDLEGGNGFSRSEPRVGADWDFLSRLRDRWPGDLIIKGVTSPEDAMHIQSSGADAIYVSNHGGRQLDSAPASIDTLPHIRAAVGSGYPLLFDSGVRSGEDVVKALALGADFVMIGRPWMYALGADGERGLVSLLRILTDELSITLAQVGLCRIEEITPDVVAERHVERVALNSAGSATQATRTLRHLREAT